MIQFTDAELRQQHITDLQDEIERLRSILAIKDRQIKEQQASLDEYRDGIQMIMNWARRWDHKGRE